LLYTQEQLISVSKCSSNDLIQIGNCRQNAPDVLGGLLYCESNLPLEEHYTDTHGYTENNFAAFAMLGRRFSPRIKGIQKQ